MHLGLDESPVEETAEQFHRFRIRQFFAKILLHSRLQSSHGLGGMIGTPIEGRDGLNEGPGIVVFQRMHSIYDNVCGLLAAAREAPITLVYMRLCE